MSNLRKEIEETINNATNQSEENIFQILGLEYKELIHSRFIAYLLAPNGNLNTGSFKETNPKHNYEKKFLFSFFEAFEIDYDKRCNYEVCIEYEDENLDGRADIVIKNYNEKQWIFIENKINANDQDKQLERYYNFLKNKEKYDLIYLTTDGHEPELESTGKLKKEQFKIKSYQDIENWLVECIKICKARKDELFIKYIKDYLNVVKNLIVDYKIGNLIINEDKHFENLNYLQEYTNKNAAEIEKTHIENSLSNYVYPDIIKKHIIPAIKQFPEIKKSLKSVDFIQEKGTLYIQRKNWNTHSAYYYIFLTIEENIIKIFPIKLEYGNNPTPKWFYGKKQHNSIEWINWARRKTWVEISIEQMNQISDNLKKNIVSIYELLEMPQLS